YQMRNELCQLLLQESENLLGAIQATVGGQLLQPKRPIEDGVSPKITHGALDRVGRPVQQLPVLRVDRPPDFVNSPRMFFEKCLRDVSQQIPVAAADFQSLLP